MPADRLEALPSENGDLRTAELAERASMSRDEVLKLLRDSELAGRGSPNWTASRHAMARDGTRSPTTTASASESQNSKPSERVPPDAKRANPQALRNQSSCAGAHSRALNRNDAAP